MANLGTGHGQRAHVVGVERGQPRFNALGQARYANGLFELNFTGGNNADLQIALTGNPTLVAGDVIL